MNKFTKDETGAITVDWVVISAGLVGLGIAVTSLVSGAVDDRTDAVRSTVNRAQIVTDFGAWRLGETFSFNYDANDPDVTVTPAGWGELVETDEIDGWVSSAPSWNFMTDAGAGTASPNGNGFFDTAHVSNDTFTRTMDSFADGEDYTFSFAAVDSFGDNAVEVWFGGELLGTVQDGYSTTTTEHSFTLTGGAGDGSNQVELREVGTNDVHGTYLTDLKIY